MIFLSRMKGEGIVIGDHIVITVDEIEGDQVHLNIERPPEVPVVKRNTAGAIRREPEVSTRS